MVSATAPVQRASRLVVPTMTAEQPERMVLTVGVRSELAQLSGLINSEGSSI
jgi:hypothetical protein